MSMTPAQQAKLAGLKSLKQAADMVGKPAHTLRNWHRDAPDLFRVVLAGCAAIQKGATHDDN